ncbi:ABC transporter substrate-binding protein [Glycomyces paridis]|uniref:ABC transporter substrate-binding protein n=1 Tax=Glycomyces paridis TaxID=2126555 RepID=A0A4S8PE03_9ACTN|nr:ABC transporter substrate-binding protein [Glycomyces paridis]THV28607.1 ABC transporter substrate-binding protein [Glycomyces paridis]
MTKRRHLPAIFATVALASACTDDEGSEGGGDPGGMAIDDFPRRETLYTTGSAWEPPSDFNTVSPGQVTGLNGLGYEFLYLFDTAEQRLTPWLAEFGDWTAADVFELTLRDGILWSDGKQMTADDVVYTVELGKIRGVPYGHVWTLLESAEAVDALTVRFTFKEARHQVWDNFLYTTEIVPKHVFEQYSEEDLVNGALDPEPVVSGPYEVHSFDEERLAWVKREDWWATEALGLEVQPRFIVDHVTLGNAETLTRLIDGSLDLANNFLPGIADYIEGEPRISTYYDKPPFMAAANTAMLIPNTTRKPLDDPAFRRAMAFAISPGEIVDAVYGGMVAEASPTGLLPIWEHYYDAEALAEDGFAFESSRAIDVLREAGYEDRDGDGFVEDLDGESFAFKLVVPAGWTDWEAAARSIASDLRDVGIDVTEEFIDAADVDAARGSGDFDLLINNGSGITNSPWSHYRYLYELPVGETQTVSNFSRWESEDAWELTQQLATVATEDESYPKLIAELQRLSLRELPAIPIWYNGAWSQASNAVWTGWPSEESEAPVYPNFWAEMWGLGAVRMLTNLKLVE